MKIRTTELRKGKKFRKVIYLNGKKHYAVLKVVAIQSYKKAHGQDIKRSSKAERGW